MPVKIENVYGSLVISDEVIGTIAGNEATKCAGVAGMAFKSKADEIASLLKKESASKGVKIFSNNKSLSLELHIITEYGISIPAISNNIIENVKFAVQSMTGYDVDKIIIFSEGVSVRHD